MRRLRRSALVLTVLVLGVSGGSTACSGDRQDGSWPQASASASAGESPGDGGDTETAADENGGSSGGSNGEGASGNPGTSGAGDDDEGNKFDVGEGSGGPIDTAGEYCGEDIDVVFVLDVSTSMDEFFNKLEAGILEVDAALKQLNLESQPQYGLVVFVDDTLIVSSGQPFVDAGALNAEFMQWNQFTASNNQVGGGACSDCAGYATQQTCDANADCLWVLNTCFQTCGGSQNTTWPENSLDALYQAATEFQWRPSDTTQRIVIHVTDDTFWEGPAMQNGVQILHNYTETVAKLQQEEIRSFSFADTIGGECDCEDVSMGWFGPHNGQPSIPDATDAQVFDINDVLSGQVSLGDAIPAAIEESLCEPYPPPG